jgi:hypothetical protein
MQKEDAEKSTYVAKNTPGWFESNIATLVPVEIFVWRSVSVKVLRTFAHKNWGGRGLLRLLFWLEERFPHWFGKNGNYPLVVISKPLAHQRESV